jgi:hypothetical protein
LDRENDARAAAEDRARGVAEDDTAAALRIGDQVAAPLARRRQPGLVARRRQVANHGGGGSEAVTFSPASGIPGSAAPSASNFVLSKTANKIPVGFIVDTVDSRLYFLGVDGNVHYIPYT